MSWSAVLCFVACWAAFYLASTYYIPVAPPSPPVMMTKTVSRHCLESPGGQPTRRIPSLRITGKAFKGNWTFFQRQPELYNPSTPITPTSMPAPHYLLFSPTLIAIWHIIYLLVVYHLSPDQQENSSKVGVLFCSMLYLQAISRGSIDICGMNKLLESLDSLNC